ncbi:Tctex-1 [Myxozyma melibiosi]|uniref:Topoisomerase I damage affected protein 2 n=1 Tax=Myxozyma melibiosi TaxID=54550 RepID=A0ABR1FD71_9ASCO
MTTPRLSAQGTKLAANSPIPTAKLEDICSKALSSIIQPTTVYKHDSTASWNDAIINTILKSLVAESSTCKYVVYSTIIQNEPAAVARGIHSTSGAYWNNEKDGLWNYSWTGGAGDEGLYVVISIAWITNK